MSVSRQQCEIFKSLWYRVYFDMLRVKKGEGGGCKSHDTARSLLCKTVPARRSFWSTCIICCKLNPLPLKSISFLCDGKTLSIKCYRSLLLTAVSQLIEAIR